MQYDLFFLPLTPRNQAAKKRPVGRFKGKRSSQSCFDVAEGTGLGVWAPPSFVIVDRLGYVHAKANTQ